MSGFRTHVVHVVPKKLSDKNLPSLDAHARHPLTDSSNIVDPNGEMPERESPRKQLTGNVKARISIFEGRNGLEDTGSRVSGSGRGGY